MGVIKKEKLFSLKLTKEALDILEKYSKEQGISKTSIVEMALRLWDKKGNKND